MKNFVGAFRKFQKLTILIYKNNWRYVWAVTIMCIIVFVFDALAPSIMVERIFNALALGNTQYLIQICVEIALILGLILLIGVVFSTYSDAWFLLIANHSCSKLFQEFFKMPHADVCNQFSDGEIYNRLIRGAHETISVFAASTQLVTTAVSSIILLLLLVQKSYQFLWLAVLYFIAIAIRTAVETKKNTTYQTNIQQSASKQTHQVHLLLEQVEQVQMCGMTTILTDQWMEHRKTYWNWKSKRANVKALFDFISAVTFGAFQVIAYGILQIIQPAIAIITSVMTLLNRYNENLMIACDCAANLPSYYVPINRLTDFLQKFKVSKREKSTQNAEKSTVLSLTDVNLTVNGNHILKDISFSVKQNEKVALIGQNGCGKSTVLKAIMGQFHVSSGEIYLFNERDTDALSYIPVAPQLFSVSAMDNISMGTERPEHEYRKSIALDFLEQTATELSGGQQQRVNIYRGVVGNRNLLIADEPTSALNPELKDSYMDFIIQSSSTLIVVTHDPMVLSRFDKIIIMDHGTVAACGNYSDLIQTDAYLQWIGSLDQTSLGASTTV